MRIYVATGFEFRERVHSFIQLCRDHGVDVEQTYDWTTGTFQDDPLEVAEGEFDGVVAADAFVALLPGGLGTHSELGMALAAEVPTVVVGSTPQRCVGQLLPQVEWPKCPAYHLVDRVVATELEAVEWLRELADE